jgi:thiamine-monophosphate kinase
MASVEHVGEFQLIAQLAKKFSQNKSVIVGSGDDAAVVAMPDGDVVVSTDIAVENVHFKKAWSSATEIGQRIAAQNLSDIVAMGAYPTALTVGIVIPKSTEVSFLEGLVVGIEEECKKVGASVVGGDMSIGTELAIAITVLGQRRGNPTVLRNGAKVGDEVFVAGNLGLSIAGLTCLQAGHVTPKEFVSAFRIPSPPYEIGPLAAIAGATSMIDVSDGLVADLGHIAKQSGAVINLDSAALAPSAEMVNVAGAFGQDARMWVLTGGEDHALVATFAKGANVPEGMRKIGEVTESGAGQVLVDGAVFTHKSGHDHFA